MSKHGLTPYIENFVWESSIDIYPPQHKSKRSQEDVDYPEDSAGKSFYDETINRFIDQFCHIQIKHKVPLKDLLDTIEKVILTRVLSRFNGHQKATSRFLRIKNTTLHEKIKKHKIRIEKTVQ